MNRSTARIVPMLAILLLAFSACKDDPTQPSVDSDRWTLLSDKTWRLDSSRADGVLNPMLVGTTITLGADSTFRSIAPQGSFTRSGRWRMTDANTIQLNDTLFGVPQSQMMIFNELSTRNFHWHYAIGTKQYEEWFSAI